MYQPNFRFAEGPLRGRGIYDPAVISALAAAGISAQRRSGFAMDAQPGLVTVPNGGIPAWMANFHDPDIVRVLMAPLKATEVFGIDKERKVGDMATATTSFSVVERTGETSAYGDYNNNGSAGINASFPYRQSFNFQTVIQYGVLETERMSLAGINLIGEKKDAATWTINQFRNTTYFYGVSGLQNYGILNDPILPAPVQPAVKVSGNRLWINGGVVTATPNEIYNDVLTMYYQLVTQAKGLIDLDSESELTLMMSAGAQTAVKAANSFGITALKLIQDNFPNIRIKTAPQYSTSAGELVQLIADKIEGQRTGDLAFTEKLRAFPLIPDLSSFKQKLAGGTWGAIWRAGYAVVQMLGV